MSKYDKHFFMNQHGDSRQSAHEVVPLVVELVHPQSVVDVGCGVGTWLAEFREHGVKDLLGIDGEYVDPDMLQIPAENFQAADLRHQLRTDKTFDLVVSLEVGEHLPEEYAETFVNSLIDLGPVVLFSAAVPTQGGVRHINEQWPDYWHDLFSRRGYLVVDALRKKIWKNEKIASYYRQNVLIFVDENHLPQYELLEKEYQRTDTNQLSLVHPEMFTRTPGVRPAVKTLLSSSKNAFRRRIRRIAR